MKITEYNYKWNGTLVKRTATDYIVVHHCAGNMDPVSVHQDHVNMGWVGIGYHFYVRKDGSVWRGRPVSTIGAHCSGHNNNTLGICFEGNYDKEKSMPKVQLDAGRSLVTYLKNLYPKAVIKKHRDFGGTVCPGKNFPFDEIMKGEQQMTVEDAVEIVQAKAGLEDGTMEFLLSYKYGEELLVKLAEAMV